MQIIGYIKPIWYFNINPNDGQNRIWVHFDQLSKVEKELIKYDKNYSNPILSNWDASYQALMKGIIKQTGNNILMVNIEFIPAADIYRFMRKYYKKIWLYGTFFQRLLYLYNPISEFIGLWQTRKVKNTNIFHTYYYYEDYPHYNSSLIKSNPLINIIIPTLNRYKALKNVLNDLEKQLYSNFKVIIIDQSNPFQGEFYNQFSLNNQIIRQEKPALWRARNRGIQSSKSEYLLFLDDDSRIHPDWISEHLKCLDYFEADISSGVSISKIGAGMPENYSFFRWSDQLDTGNVLIKKKVFKKCGLFDEQFEKMRMGDGEFGLRAYINGFKNISNHKASREHLKIAKGGLRDMGHWDSFRPKNIFSPRPVPSVLYYYRKYWGNKNAILQIIFTMPFSLSPYYLKSNIIGYCISMVIFTTTFPFIFYLFLSSWIRSSKMINEGDKISKI